MAELALEEVRASLPSHNPARRGATRRELPSGVPPTTRTLLLIEDDREDALLVQALLEEAADEGEPSGLDQFVWADSLEAAMPSLGASPACVLLDLGLPDISPADALAAVLAAAPEAAVVVLTGLDDEENGLDAISQGAQDYLVKATADGRRIAHSVRYATERKRAAETAQRNQEVEIRAQENVRLERGLLPRPLLRSDRIQCMTLYRPGGDQSLLGGDFFDVVELEDGLVRAMIGDVSGHGPDEAALGVRLRVAWRTLVLAGVPPEQTFDTLQDLFHSERPSAEVFVTMCDVSVSSARDTVRILLAGHPAPIIVNGGVTVAFAGKAGPPLGVVDQPNWPTNDVPLDEGWALVLYTDGLVENWEAADEGRHERLGPEGLLEVVRRAVGQGRSIERIVQETLARLQGTTSSALTDDVAIVALSARPGII